MDGDFASILFAAYHVWRLLGLKGGWREIFDILLTSLLLIGLLFGFPFLAEKES